MAILRLEAGQVEWGGRALLDHADLNIEAGERIGLIGRNGEGKSTLLQALAGLYPLDGGNLWIAPGLSRAYLAQEPELEAGHDLLTAIKSGHPAWRQLQQAEAGDTQAHALADHHDVWQIDYKAEALRDSLGLPAEGVISALSGGLRKRVAIAAAMVSEPDILFFDEPTNHLDLPAILALEQSLLRYRGTLVFITHDRRFLDRLTTRIVELDRGILRSFPGSFGEYQARKAEVLAAEAAADNRLEGQLAEEEAWLRQGVKARAKRNQGRLRRLESLREERASRRQQQGQASLQISTAERSGALIAELEQVSFHYAQRPIIRNFSTRIERGDRVGIIGPNGAGKTTLLRLILGELEPQEGKIRRGTKQEVAYFDQMRATLDPESRVVDAIADGNDFIEINGERRHVLGYLQDFLFPPSRARGLIKALSGGERARLLLARLFARPANILVLDEPTNDLDLETLEVLEERLQNYTGTLFLVSHDRDFLDNVVTQVIAFGEEGQLTQNAGGYEDWIRWQTEIQRAASKTVESSSGKNASKRENSKKPALSYKETQELAQLPAQIEKLEQDQERLAATLTLPETYQNPEKLKALQAQAEQMTSALQQAYTRWELLEAKAAASAEASG
ncbi:ATP-binding cassette domain-containing protein [Acidithiobacillus montserratensis]|uniref:ATP-binding cassette domain-containing protein n=1 Tax=Acidithiobacillus montserratensis TaxID=2729135 RepID=A0ACD5HGN1_9PROT|nr:ATP-binding cassette domain-containing protein [Acidithiobacillus montserratensis]MBU2746904.1 ATP-binding cassette domain-containing protein [Acidithiobacillus montserratensis]